jgi:hypothetical protein
MTSRKPRPATWCEGCSRDLARQPHRLLCVNNRCLACPAPRTVGPFCAPCDARRQRRRKAAVQARLADMDAEW